MQIGRLGSLIGFAIGCVGGGVQMIVPDPKFYGWTLIAIGVVTLVISLPWWFFVNFRLRLPWVSRQKDKALRQINSAASSHASNALIPVRVTDRSVHLQLLFRRNQEPHEIMNQNVWRWFVYTNMAVTIKERTKEERILSTQIVLTFDQPIDAKYRRISCSNNVRAEVLDFTSRSAIVSIKEVELADWTIDIQFSGTPI